MTTRLTVSTDRPYDVVIGNGVQEEVRGLVGVGLGVMRVAIIHSPRMAKQAEILRKPLVADALEVHLIEVPDGEKAKSADVLAFCWKVLGESGFTRSDVIVGLDAQTARLLVTVRRDLHHAPLGQVGGAWPVALDLALTHIRKRRET